MAEVAGTMGWLLLSSAARGCIALYRRPVSWADEGLHPAAGELVASPLSLTAAVTGLAVMPDRPTAATRLQASATILMTRNSVETSDLIRRIGVCNASSRE